jgi:hypothetical protein
MRFGLEIGTGAARNLIGGSRLEKPFKKKKKFAGSRMHANQVQYGPTGPKSEIPGSLGLHLAVLWWSAVVPPPPFRSTCSSSGKPCDLGVRFTSSPSLLVAMVVQH